MLGWLKQQGMQVAMSFMVGLIADCSDDVVDQIKAFVIEKYQKAMGTDKEWDELWPAFVTDLLAEPDQQPMFMTELKEALVEPLTALYKWCVEKTEWTGDEQLVLVLFEVIGKPVPTLSLAEG